MVGVEAERNEGADAFLVGPVKVVFVEVEIRPVIAHGHLESVYALEDTVSNTSDDGLHRNGVMARVEAVSLGTDVFVADGVLAGVVGVGVAEGEVKRRAPVFPRNEEFFFLFRVEAVAVDVVESVTKFQKESDLDGVLLECVGNDRGKSRLGLELAFAEYREVGGVLAEYEHRDE